MCFFLPCLLDLVGQTLAADLAEPTPRLRRAFVTSQSAAFFFARAACFSTAHVFWVKDERTHLISWGGGGSGGVWGGSVTAKRLILLLESRIFRYTVLMVMINIKLIPPQNRSQASMEIAGVPRSAQGGEKKKKKIG